MSATATHSELRLQRLMDERETTQKLHENLLAAIEVSDTKTPTESQAEQIKMYREKATNLDTEIDELAQTVEDHNRALERSKAIRRQLAGAADGVEVDGDGIVYRDFYTYARDFVLSRPMAGAEMLARKWGVDENQMLAMRERQQLIKRAPADTLSSNVGGLQPPQHLAQIFQVIDRSRPIVASATRVGLDRGTLTFPKVSQRPVVSVQAAEKTEGGSQSMHVDMETTNASTYLGGGDLSWQAINWSTPDALQLWFDLAAADYALKTETDAAQVVESAAAANTIADQLAGSAADTFADWLVAVTEGAAEVYANSGRLANAIYVSPDLFYLAAALTSAAFSQLTVAGNLDLGAQSGQIAGMRVIVSRGMHSGVAIVGDSNALIVAETNGAPVELRVVEPAIGGVEVGIIGAFEAVVAEDSAFALISTNS